MLPPVPCSAVGGILAAAEGAGKAVVYVFLQKHRNYGFFHHSRIRDLTPSPFFAKNHLRKVCKTAPQETGKTKESQQGISCVRSAKLVVPEPEFWEILSVQVLKKISFRAGCNWCIKVWMIRRVASSTFDRHVAY